MTGNSALILALVCGLVAVGYGEWPGLWSVLGGTVVVAAVTLRGIFGRN